MRVAVVGLGVQGRKRLAVAGADAVATVDPVNPAAAYRDAREVPLDAYDAALLCVPDAAKPDLLDYLLGHGKHVLVEKPLLAGDERALTRLESLARSRKVVCYTAYNHRFEPHIVRLKSLLESGRLGPVYWARFFYGNGTARDVRASAWRDQGLGVLPDLGSHLLDMALFLFGESLGPLEPWSFDRFENRSLDRVVCGSRGRPALELEMTLLSWRNSFRADVYGEAGSAHIDGLCKWGPSSFTVFRRVLPSGKPDRETETLERADPTWAKEYAHFKQLCQKGTTDLANDLWINARLAALSGKIGAAGRP
ncbi:MAG: Gfo/Idh/MocA family oxidoreductase [Elusimicrobia bacterium]|nr:Gfo/Idh/MocA family oxidoreductase [Elusimicrobiota bacterium]